MPTASDAPKLTVVLPVYNEVATIDQVIKGTLGAPIDGIDLELIIVESNSTDGTRDAVLQHAGDARVRVILQDEARGKGFAVREGLAAATGDIVLIQDGDLEYDVNDYPALLEPILEGRASFVLGSRHVKGRPMRTFTDGHAVARVMNAAHWVFTGLFDAVYGVRLRDPFTMYKVFRRTCLDGVELVSDRFDFDWELVAKLIRLGYRPVEVPVTYHSRGYESGKKVRLFRDPLTWLVALVRFRVTPLRRTGAPASLRTAPFAPLAEP